MPGEGGFMGGILTNNDNSTINSKSGSVSALSSLGKTDSTGIKLSNTGNKANIPTQLYGLITPTDGRKLNEAEVQANAATAAAYAQAQINRPDQYTPYGSSTWETDPETGQATNKVTLDDAQQALLDAQTGTQTKLSTVGSSLADQVAKNYSKDLDFSGLPQVDYSKTQKNVATPTLNTSIQPYGTIQNNLDAAGSIQKNVDTSGTGNLTRNASYGNIQNNIDMNGIPELVGGKDLLKFQSDARDAAWNNSKATLDPQWNDYETGLETKLANQGVMQNSEAWNKALASMSKNRQYDYSQAQNNAVNQGLTAAQQLYSQGLSSNQNAYNQRLNNGNFANSAQAQGFGQAYNNAQLNNSADLQALNNKIATMTANNSAQQQGFNQNEARGTFANSAQNQGFAQNQTNAAFGNTAAEQAFNMDAQNAALNNSGINQDFTNSINNRNQNINELMQQRGDSLSALTSILNGTQATMPQFSSTNVVGGIESPNTMNGLTATKNANAATTAAKYGALGNIASSALKIAKIPGLG